MNPDLDDNATFSDFMLRLKSNDARAWARLRFVLRRVITYWLVSKGRKVAEADLIYHETFTTFYELYPRCTFENFHKLKSYVLSIADKKTKEWLRQKKTHQQLQSLEGSHLVRYPEETVYAEPAEQIGDRDLVKMLLRSLGNKEREILYGYFYRGEKLKQIARKLGLSEGNIRVIKHRALKKLRTKISELE